MSPALPIVIIGAGPIGLAAAVHVLERGLRPIVLEAEKEIGSGPRRWGHVRMFSPWVHDVDPAAVALLEKHGWVAPDPAGLPTGRELVEQYLEPLAALPELAGRIELGARVTAVARARRDRMKSAGRETTPFLVRYLQDGEELELTAGAVIDASGTLGTPNPAGAAGIPARGEGSPALRPHLAYGMPDLLGEARGRYAGRRILVVGSGHSAIGVLLDGAQLAAEAPGTELHWALRRDDLAKALGGGSKDQLAERGRLGERLGQLVVSGALRVHAGFHLDRFVKEENGVVAMDGVRRLPAVDEVVVATGFRPDLSFLSELRLGLDPGTESPRVLAPLIDPNLHSCGTVPPHGAEELRHPEEGLYLVGMKSYGRAPTFLLRTGYEQVRSVAAAFAGDWEAARRVELVLPQTGICSTSLVEGKAPAAAGCCGGPAVADAAACCADDEAAKAAGETGCGCGAVAAPADPLVTRIARPAAPKGSAGGPAAVA